MGAILAGSVCIIYILSILIIMEDLALDLHAHFVIFSVGRS